MALRIDSTQLVEAGKGLVVLAGESVEELLSTEAHRLAVAAGPKIGLFNCGLDSSGGCYQRLRDGSPCESEEGLRKLQQQSLLTSRSGVWYKDYYIRPSSIPLPTPAVVV